MTDEIPDLKLRALVNFPVSVTGRTAINIEKVNGRYSIDLDVSDLVQNPNVSVDLVAQKRLLLWDSTEDSYETIPYALAATAGVASIGGNTGALDIGNGLQFTGDTLEVDLTSFSTTFETRALAIAASIPAAVKSITVKRYATGYEACPAVYSRVVSLTSGAYGFQSADGAWWQLAEKVPDVLMFGADAENPADDATEIANKAILQTAIAHADALGGGIVKVPWPVDYGYVVTDVTTHPDCSACVNDIEVDDYGNGSTTDAFGPTYKEGWQERRFLETAQTSPVGRHDGNGVRLFAKWHPNFVLDNTSTYPAVGDPSRTVNDNLRASIIWSNRGNPIWQIGTGQTKVGLTAELDEMYDLTISGLSSGFVPRSVPLIIVWRTGAFNIQAGSRDTRASTWIRHEAGVFAYDPALPTLLVEHPFSDAKITLRNSLSGDVDASWTNHLGALKADAKGIVFPSYTTTARMALTGLAEGLTVWDETLKKHFGWSAISSAWFANGVSG